MNDPISKNRVADVRKLHSKLENGGSKLENGEVCPPSSLRGSKREVFFRKILPRPAVGLLLVAAFLTGCSSTQYRHTSHGPEPVSYNVYSATPTLPADLKRVALLPLVVDGRYADLIEGSENLEPVLSAELIKARRFEVARVTPEGLKDITGSPAWSGEEALPIEFFESIRAAYACDAVMFCQLTEYRAYAPLAVGWRMKLVDTRTRQILWAGDELFDSAQEPAVPEQAYRYWLFLPAPELSSREWALKNSPRNFAQYTMDRLFATLPER